MCVVNKLNSYNNYRCNICCGLTSIFWREHIFEGKYCPRKHGQRYYAESGDIISLMLRMCKPIFVTGNYLYLFR